MPLFQGTRLRNSKAWGSCEPMKRCFSANKLTKKCDFYFFTHVTYDFKHCYLDGYKSKSDFFNEARIVKKGEKDKNNFRFKTDNYIVQIRNLNKFQY